MKKAIVITIVLLTGFIFTLSKVYAQTLTITPSCQPIYNGGENCGNSTILLNMLVLNPQTNTFVQNLGINDPKYHPSDIVTFQIQVSGQSNTPTATVKDTFPPSFIFSSGPGTFDRVTNTLSFTVTNITTTPQPFTIIGRVNNAVQVPVCENNNATLTANSQTVTATSQYCIENKNGVTQNNPPVTKNNPSAKANPNTGSATNMLVLFGLTGGLGSMLLKISKHKAIDRNYN